MPGEAQVLTLDLGTSGAKAAVFAASGRVLSTAFQPVALRLLPGGGAEQDPAEWWGALGTAARIRLASGKSGRIEIPFYNADDFDRVVELLLGSEVERA